MAKNKKEKTNVMRLLDQAHIEYQANYYDTSDNILDGVSVAKKIGQDPKTVYKTLVCQGHSKDFCVFVVPVEKSLALKKAASAAVEKSVAMIPQKILLPTTGYVHGGCSPVGMKKPFKTFIDESAENLSVMFVSAGKIGTQVGVEPKALAAYVSAKFVPLCE